MGWKRWKSRLRGWRWAIVLSLFMAFLVMGVSLFISSFYSYNSTGYEPKDLPRESYLEETQRGK